MGRGVARIFRVGKSRPAGGKPVAKQTALNRVEQRAEPGAPVLGRATEGDSGRGGGAYDGNVAPLGFARLGVSLHSKLRSETTVKNL
jgi:hypothetical protein